MTGTEQVLVPDGQEDVWLSHLQESPSIKVLGANVYETFCQPPAAEAQPELSWTAWMADAAANWL